MLTAAQIALIIHQPCKLSVIAPLPPFHHVYGLLQILEERLFVD